MRAKTEEEIVAAIRAAAQWAGVSVEELTAERYREAQRAGHGGVNHGTIHRRGTWAHWTRKAALPTEPKPQGHQVAGISTYVGPDGTIKGQWIKTKREQESREEALRRILEDLPTTIPVREERVPAPRVSETDLLAVYPMGDPHVGMLSWHEETGEDYDLPRARELLCQAIDQLSTSGQSTRRALIVNLGDFFHADDSSSRTSRSGNVLDTDTRWAKTLRVGVEIMVHHVDAALRAHEHVAVINAIGNHDDHSAIMLSVALAAHYRTEPRVEVDLSPAAYRYHRWGACLFGVHHGHGAKPGDLESIMAADRPHDWGETRHRVWLCGHTHHARKLEARGCMVESFRTLAPRDAWAHGEGYRAGRDMHRIVYHREWGEMARTVVSADYLRALYRAA